MKLSVFAAAAASLLLAVSRSAADPLSYQPGDLFLGFRANAGVGATQDYVVNLGSATQFTGGTQAFTVPNLGNIAQDLVDVFGADWKIHRADGSLDGQGSDVFWSITGTAGPTAAGGIPARTLFATVARRTPVTPAIPWLRANASAQAAPANRLTSLATAYLQKAGVANTSTANSPKGLIQVTTDVNSYASFQTASSSFSYFNPSVEGSFAQGTAASALDLYRLIPATGGAIGTPGDFLGTFTINDSGVLTFTPAAVQTGSTLYFGQSQYSVAEDAGTLSVTISRGGGSAAAATVAVRTLDGISAGPGTAGTDYTALDQTVSFAAGEVTKAVSIAVQNRAGFQGDRNFRIRLEQPGADSSLVNPSSIVVTILEADASLQLSASTYTASESAGTFNVTVVRGNGLAGAATVQLSTVDGSAKAGTDYVAQTNTVVSFAANETQKTVPISITNVAGFQGNRAFQVQLSNAGPGAALASPSIATITIQESEPPPVGSVAFGSATYFKAESPTGDVTLPVTVSRTGGSFGAVSISVTVGGASTATASLDYTLPATPVVLAWADGEQGSKSFDVTIKSDAVTENPAETVVLNLGSATGSVGIGSPSTATITIADADSTPPVLTLATPRAGGAFTATKVTFSGKATDAGGIDRIEVRLNGGTAKTAPGNGAASVDWSLDDVPEQGLNTVEVKAFDLQGNSSVAISRSFTFNYLRPELSGAFTGLFTQLGGAAPLDYRGIIAITVTPTGTFTGKLTLGATRYSVAGVFLADGSARFGKTRSAALDLLRKVGSSSTSAGLLSLSISTSGTPVVTGSVAAADTTPLSELTHADRPKYSAKSTVPTTLLDPVADKGAYTSLWKAGASPNGGLAADAFPQGDGWSFTKLSKTGSVKITGKLADGTALAYTGSLVTGDALPVYLPLYAGKGSVSGTVSFDPSATGSDASGSIAWHKASSLATPKSYPNGWPNGITLQFQASKYVAPKAPATPLGNAIANANINISLFGGSFAPATSDDGSLDTKGRIVLVSATPQVAKLKLAITPATGALNGSFSETGSPKTLKFGGVALQKSKEAGGFFLTAPATPSVTPVSGGVSVTAK